METVYITDFSPRKRQFNRRMLWVIPAVCMLFAVSSFPTRAFAPKPKINPWNTSSSQAVLSDSTQSPGAGQLATSGLSSKKVKNVVPSAPHCTPAAAFSSSKAPAVDATRSLLIQPPITPYTYNVYGDAIADITNQINRCSPVVTAEGKFAASTDYSLSWAYSFTVDDTGLCRVAEASVGLSVSQVMPKWQPTAHTPKSVSRQWDAFYADLLLHENGHAVLDQQYAQKLFNELQGLQSINCDQIDGIARNIVRNNLSELRMQNEAYDAHTEHGVTQGAILR